MATKLYKNITDKKIVLPVTFDEIPAGGVYSISTEYHQPLNVDGLIEITELSKEEQAKTEKESLKELQKKREDQARERGASNEQK